MRQLGLKCLKFKNKSRRYNSYKETVGRVAKNKINRRFMIPYKLQNLVTDVTEFKCLDDEKLYLSPIMDLYNKEIIAWEISNSPTIEIVIEPLKVALSVVKEYATYRTTLYSGPRLALSTS